MAKYLFLLLIVLGCAKSPCVIAVDATFNSPDYKSIRYIEVHFQQGERVVLADVIYDYEFKEGVFYLRYYFYDTNPDLMVWKVYAIDRTSKEYKTKI